MRGPGKLTQVSVKAAGVGRHSDGGNLYLVVKPNGSRLWQMKYRRPGGREATYSIGTFPEVGLAEARQERDVARSLLRHGQDPVAERRARRLSQAAAQSRGFAEVARTWLRAQQPHWQPDTLRKARLVLETYLIPALSGVAIDALSTPQAVKALDRLHHRPTLARKGRQYLNSIVDYAILKGLREEGRLLRLQGAVSRAERGHIPAATDLDAVAAVVRAVRNYDNGVVRRALELTMLTAMRPGVVAAARWNDFNFDREEWLVPAHVMKMRRSHIVPLPAQAIVLLREMAQYSAEQEFVFPPLARQKTPHLARDTLSAALRRMGFAGQHAAHGFRAMLRTVGRERLHIDADVLEAQLAHARRGEVQQAYDRTGFLEERRAEMQRWADFLDHLAGPPREVDDDR